jgi:hypothetical protein
LPGGKPVGQSSIPRIAHRQRRESLVHTFVLRGPDQSFASDP